jgi:hypothetical protein
MKVLLTFLDSLNYKYKQPVVPTKPDATSYLLASDAMKNHLERSIDEANAGKVQAIATEDLWK